jgi:transcription-repair coupling factor (superfamily II helicase)
VLEARASTLPFVDVALSSGAMSFVVSTSAEFLEASWSGLPRAARYRSTCRNVFGTASFWTVAQLRNHAPTADRPW